jgi:hypothetical protein
MFLNLKPIIRPIFLLSAIIAFLFSNMLLAQGTVTLTGKVTDEKTGKPLPFANVFINNSTIGTNADENGNYKLGNLTVGNLEMVVSFLGYETVKQTLRFEQPGTKTIMFKLREGQQLQGVTVYAKKNKRRERNLKIITRELLGTNRFSKLCKIVNPEVLRISEDDDGHLGAQTTRPLIIENYALGYRIHQDLDDFDYYNGKVYYGGATRFENLPPKDETQKKMWRANQKIAYQGSLKHLLASIVADSVVEQGFKLYQAIPDSMRMFKSVRSVNGYNTIANHVHNRIEQVRGVRLVRPGELPTERLVVSLTQLEVFNMKQKGRSPYSDMPYAYSQITMPQGYIVITAQGWVVMPMGFEIAGDFGKDRFSNLLPADWKRDD